MLYSKGFVFRYDITYWPTSMGVYLPSKFFNNENGRCKSSLKKTRKITWKPSNETLKWPECFLFSNQLKQLPGKTENFCVYSMELENFIPLLSALHNSNIWFACISGVVKITGNRSLFVIIHLVQRIYSCFPLPAWSSSHKKHNFVKIKPSFGLM